MDIERGEKLLQTSPEDPLILLAFVKLNKKNNVINNFEFVIFRLPSNPK